MKYFSDEGLAIEKDIPTLYDFSALHIWQFGKNNNKYQYKITKPTILSHYLKKN